MKRFYLYPVLIAGLTLSSCINKHEGEQKTSLLSNVLSISDNEDKGVKEILGFYGGRCEYSIGYSASNKEKSGKYFELEMSKSELIGKSPHLPEMAASNIAYLFYHNLKEEKNNYIEIHSVIIEDGKEPVTYEYPKEDLELVDKKMKVVEKITDLLKNRRFDDLLPLFNTDTNLVKIDKKLLLANLAKVDAQCGAIKSFVPCGFRFDKVENAPIRLLHLSGVVICEKENHALSVYIDSKSANDEIMYLQYDF